MFFLQHQSLVGGPNPSCCPICNKLCMTGELLMEHMKFVHKDPNASGVPGRYFLLLIPLIFTLNILQPRDAVRTTRVRSAGSSTLTRAA